MEIDPELELRKAGRDPNLTPLMRTSLFLALLLGTTASVGEAAAQQIDPCPTGSTVSSDREPDVVIRARVHADELRFETQPEVDVRLTGCAILDTIRVTERINLPDPVEPGVTYRDVTVGVEIMGYLNVQCLLPELVQPEQPDSLAAATDALRRLCARGEPQTPLGGPR